MVCVFVFVLSNEKFGKYGCGHIEASGVEENPFSRKYCEKKNRPSVSFFAKQQNVYLIAQCHVSVCRYSLSPVFYLEIHQRIAQQRS